MAPVAAVNVPVIDCPPLVGLNNPSDRQNACAALRVWGTGLVAVAVGVTRSAICGAP